MLKEIRERLSKISKYPWSTTDEYQCQERDNYKTIITDDAEPWSVADILGSGPNPEADAEFIAHAPEDIATLLQLLDEAKETLRTVLKDNGWMDVYETLKKLEDGKELCPRCALPDTIKPWPEEEDGIEAYCTSCKWEKEKVEG